MQDTNILLNKMNSTGKKEYTTSELKELNITPYFIKKLTVLGALEHIKRGKYRLIIPNETVNFKQFREAILEGEYKKAYQILKKLYALPENQAYTEHIYLYFSFLKPLLNKEKIDFTFIEEMPVMIHDLKSTSSLYTYWIQFESAVYSSDFYNALLYIERFSEKQKERNQQKISTQLFTHLTKEVIAHLEKEYKEKKKEELTSSFQTNFNQKKYEQCLPILEELCYFVNSKAKRNIGYLKDLLEQYFILKQGQKILEEKMFTYPETIREEEKFEQALLYKDYHRAIDVIEMFKQSGQNIAPAMPFYEEILTELLKQNEINKQRKETIEDAKRIELVEQLLKEEQYDEVYPLLQRCYKDHPQEKKFYYFMRLLDIQIEMERSKKIPLIQDIPYQSKDTQVFKRFFEALRRNDFEYALSCTLACQNYIERKKQNTTEFIFYNSLLKNIVAYKNYIQITLPKIEEVEREMSTYCSYGSSLHTQDVFKLKKLLEQKISLIHFSHPIEEYLLNLIETIEKAMDDDTITKSSFARVSTSKETLLTSYYEAMKYGDYITAYQNILEPSWDSETKKDPDKTYLILSKKLLRKLMNTLRHNENIVKMSKQRETKDEFTFSKVDQLSRLKQFVKKRDYVGAYIYYIENDLKFDQNNFIMKTLLTFVMNIQKEEEMSYLRKSRFYYDRGDLENSKKWMDTYKEAISGKALDRDLKYHYRKIELKEKRIDHPQFVLSENIYDRACYYYQQEKYAEALALTTQYTELIDGLSSKGYILAGQIYERLHNLKKAKENYTRAIEIIPAPFAYFRLGRCCLFKKEFSESIENHLAAVACKPGFYARNLNALADTYQSMNDMAHCKEYRMKAQIARTLSNTRTKK